MWAICIWMPSTRALSHTSAIRMLWLVTVALMMGCRSSSTDEAAAVINSDPEVLAKQAQIAEQEVAAALADDPRADAEIIDGVSHGLIGDGKTDNTAVFHALLSTGDRVIRIPEGDYVTGPLWIPANTTLVLEPGTVIRDSGSLDTHERVINIYADNVRIYGLGARVVSNRAHYTTGEHRHGVFIWGATNVVIDGLESSDNGGDGFLIGGSPGDPATDITLRGCAANNNRRQGLSVNSARRLWIVDCSFSNTSGTAPEFGIDIEPDEPEQVLDQITILRPQTSHNRGGGIMVLLNNLNQSSQPVEINIIEHFSSGESTPFRPLSTNSVPNLIRYSRHP